MSANDATYTSLVLRPWFKFNSIFKVEFNLNVTIGKSYIISDLNKITIDAMYTYKRQSS